MTFELPDALKEVEEKINANPSLKQLFEKAAATMPRRSLVEVFMDAITPSKPYPVDAEHEAKMKQMMAKQWADIKAGTVKYLTPEEFEAKMEASRKRGEDFKKMVCLTNVKRTLDKNSEKPFEKTVQKELNRHIARSKFHIW